MQLSTRVVTLSYTFQLLFLLIISKVKPFAFIECEKHIDVLMGVVNGIVALEIQKTCRATHSTHRRHERNSFTAIVDRTSSTGFYC